jgi:sugar phosphate permease
MPIKIFAAALAVTLVLGFLSPVVFKLKDVALTVIILIGVGMMLIDLWQSLHREED